MFRSVGILLAVLALAVSPLAQNIVTNCELTIRIRVEDRDYGGHVMIELLAPGGSTAASAGTNQDGSAYFQVQSGVTYSARVSGRDIETSTQQFHIMGGELNHSEYINVRLLNSDSAPPPKTKDQDRSATVSVSEMNVPPKAKEEMQKGNDAFAKGDLATAQQCFEKAVSIYPKYARAYANLGIIAAKSGDRVKARELFSKAVEADDKFLPAYVSLARMDFQDKDYKKAEEELRKVLNQNPTMTDALALLASAEYGNKDYDAALVDAQRVHMQPNHEQYASMHLLAAQVLEMQSRNDEAIAEYRIFLKEDPNSPQAPKVRQALADLQATKQ